jgi:hypothetical protein
MIECISSFSHPIEDVIGHIRTMTQGIGHFNDIPSVIIGKSACFISGIGDTRDLTKRVINKPGYFA